MIAELSILHILYLIQWYNFHQLSWSNVVAQEVAASRLWRPSWRPLWSLRYSAFGNGDVALGPHDNPISIMLPEKAAVGVPFMAQS
jgi:hypothetical protein